jgi:thymidylate synthase (FAD)
MLIVQQKAEILYPTNVTDGTGIVRAIELAARTCYRSEDAITDDSYAGLIKNLIQRGHNAMLEHGQDITVRFTCGRAIANEIVRHRMMSFAQESTRYCNYGKGKFNNEITVIMPLTSTEYGYGIWYSAMVEAQTMYLTMLKHGEKPEIARGVLPLDLKTELVAKANVREWRHVFDLRCAPSAHPQIRCLMHDLMVDLSQLVPIVFNDLIEKYQ